MPNPILMIGLLIFLGHLLAAFFTRTRIPDVLLLILVGIAVGPQVLNWSRPEDFGKIGPIFSNLALLVILFEGGMHLRASMLRSCLHTTVALAAVTFILTFVVLAVVANAALHSLYPSLLLSGILCSTSAAVILPMIRSLGLGDEGTAMVTIETVLADVGCVVLVYGLLRYEATTVSPLTGIPLAGNMLYEIAMASLFGAIAAIGWLTIVDYLRQVPNTLFAELAFACMLYGFAELAHVSGPIAVLVFGITLVNLPPHIFRKIPLIKWLRLGVVTAEKRSAYSEAVFLMKLAFFVYLGISVKLTDWTAWMVGAVMVLLMYLLRFVIAHVLVPRRLPWRDAFVISVMVPKGLVTAVLAATLRIRGIPQADFMEDVAFAVILLSILLTSIAVSAGTVGWMGRFTRWMFKDFADLPPAPVPVKATPTEVASATALPESDTTH